MSKLLLGASFLAIYSMAMPSRGGTTTAVTSKFCSAPEYRQFDYWLGDWDTYRIKDGKTSDTPVARNHVTSILSGCALHESYVRKDGYAGESFTSYDASRKVWHQTWVSNQGELNVVEGTQQGNRIVLTGSVIDAQGLQLQRVSWEPVKGGVREICLGSRDGGKTWTILFDVLFLPHAS